jgi:hypothetical protein
MDFSWKRAIKHAAIPCLLVFVAGLALGVNSADPEKAGEGVGRFLVVVFGVSAGVSYLVQTGRKKAAIGVAVGSVALVVLAVVALWNEGGGHRKPPPGFRAPMLATSDGRLEQPGLGFSIPHPGSGFIEKPELAAMASGAGADRDAMYYAYADTGPTAVLVVTITADVMSNRVDLERFADGVERGFQKEAIKVGSAPPLVRNIVWTSERRDVTMSGKAGEGSYRVRVFARPRYTLAITVASSDPTALAPVLDDVRF